MENTYAVMIGSIRNTSAQHNQRHIMVFQIFPVTDLNDVTAHTLQIVYISLKSEDLEQQVSQNQLWGVFIVIFTYGQYLHLL